MNQNGAKERPLEAAGSSHGGESHNVLGWLLAGRHDFAIHVPERNPPRMSALRRLILVLIFLWPHVVFCEVHFAQLTDPHLFDPGEEVTNEYMLQWCISCINSNVQQGVHYNFILVTGDLGVEKLAKNELTNSSGEFAGPTHNEITNAVETFANNLSASQVKRWLFVPGNNDLLKENPASIVYYRMFMQALAERLGGSGMVIKDLTAREGDPTSGFQDESATATGTNLLRFVGFNNASFKGNYSESDANAFESNQLKEIFMVRQHIPPESQTQYKGTFIFYHIPEIEDPYLVSVAADDATLLKIEAARGLYAKQYPRSAWTVTQKVRDAWSSIVTNDRVHGLFAGHFHSSNRAVYEGFGWMLDPAKYTSTLQKLLIAPPIAIKKQGDKPEPARGYREVYIDGETGAVTKTEVIFYAPSPLILENSDNERHSERSVSRWDMAVNFVLAPCFVLTILGAFVWGFSWAFKKSGFAVSSSTHNAIIVAGVWLGAIIIGFAALGTLTQCQGKDICRVLGVGVLWALAALASGGALGILFGAPRSPATPAKDGTARAKTLLEDMADWLSKLIVGGSLFESRKILNLLEVAGHNFAATVSCPESCLWSGVGSALLVYFGLVGFFGAYFLMRLYLARAIEDADGRPVVSDRTGLPQTKLDALEDAPLSVESTESDAFDKGFGPIAREAANEIGAVPLESLTNWKDIRLWAKAKLSRKEVDAALNAYQKAIEIVPTDAETRLGYATALSLKKSSTQLILANLEIAHDCLMKKSPRDLRKNVFKSLTYQCLYLKPPESFLKALGYAREYFEDSDPIESGGLWVNIACAYGQAHAWLKENPQNQVDPNLLMVKKQKHPGDESQLLWVRDQALMAVKTAISRDQTWKIKIQELMGEGPNKSGKDDAPKDDDLKTFQDDEEFRTAAGLKKAQLEPT